MPPDRVVIIGASTTGLFAAAAVAGPGRTVTVLERDDLPSGPVPRPGVPQGRKPHVFLHRGVLAAEQLLPGFRDDLVNVGAVPINTAHLAWLGEQGRASRTSRSFEVCCPPADHCWKQRYAAGLSSSPECRSSAVASSRAGRRRGALDGKDR